MNVVAITIGNRDIKFSDKYFFDYKKNEELRKILFPEMKEEFTIRNWGKHLFDNFEIFKNKITMPIISPFFHYLKLREILINKMIIIATDQTETVPYYYKNNDTIAFALLIETIIRSEKICKQTKIIKIGNNVNDMDSVYEELRKHFNNNKFIKEIPADADFYIIPMGGIPTINFSLLLNSIVKFKDSVLQYRVDENTASVIPISFNKNFLKELESFSIENLLAKYFFASIREASSNDFIKMISDYSYNRMNFNFLKAFSIINDLMKNPEYRNQVDTIYKDHTKLIQDNTKQLCELFFTAKIKIMQEQYVDALLRLYNFTDNLLLSKVCVYYRLKYEPEKDFTKWWFKAINKIKKENPNIESSLEKINGNNADLSKKGIPLYSVLIKYKNKDCNIFEITEPLLAISDLRNRSIAAHGFEGVSLEKINEKLEKFELNLNDLIEEIETYLGVRFEDSDYYRIADIIRNNLDK